MDALIYGQQLYLVYKTFYLTIGYTFYESSILLPKKSHFFWCLISFRIKNLINSTYYDLIFYYY